MYRTDGDHVFYILEFFYPGDSAQDGNWIHPNYDHFGTPKVTGTARSQLGSFKRGQTCTHESVDVGFSASGDCWQRLGVHGTFSKVAANEAMVYMAKKHGGKWRVVEVKASQHTRRVSSFNSERKYQRAG